MTRGMRVFPVFLVAVVALMLGIAAPEFYAGGKKDKKEKKNRGGEVVEFAETAIFLEFNFTDLDLGIQIFFDAEGWKEVEVAGPDGEIFEVENGGSLSILGSTEVFTESAEPALDEADLDASIAAFLALFPEGEYEFEGETVGGDTLIGSAMLSHGLPAPPELFFPDPAADSSAADADHVVIEWSDTSIPGDPKIVRYQVVVEFEEEETGAVFVSVVDVLADPDAFTQSVSIPVEFFDSLADLEGEYKAELLAIGANGNKTIVEEEFELED